MDDLSTENLYRAYIEAYKKGKRSQYGTLMGQLLPSLLSTFDLYPKDVLDLGSGDGSFVIQVAKTGLTVVGIDLSPEAVRVAQREARTQKCDNARFLQMDIRNLRFQTEFDVVTLWQNTVNYLITLPDVQSTFRSAFQAMRNGGLLFFDVLTVSAVKRGGTQSYFAESDSNTIEIHRRTYDDTNWTATCRLTAFLSDGGDSWRRIDEEHRERGYTIAQLVAVLTETGFEVSAIWDDLAKKSAASDKSARVWFVARKPIAQYPGS